MSEPIPQRDALKLQLVAVRGHEPSSSFFEIRPLTRDGQPAPRARGFVPVTNLDEAMARVFDLAPKFNVYIGAAPRTREAGTVDAIERVWCLWVDLDSRAALERLRDFRPLPSLVIRSGSPDCAHAYWPLHKAASPAGAQRANRRLALALDGDRTATDPARILRPAGTLNHKSDPPAEVVCSRLELNMFTLAEVVGELPDDPRYRPRPQAPPGHAVASSDCSKVIAGLVRVVREAPNGNRNRATFWAACRIAEHSAAGSVEERRAVEEIRAAALDVGLPEQEVEGTIRSGLRSGALAA